jgi:hypothetical protein
MKRPSTPTVYLGDDSPAVKAGIGDRLRLDGILVYVPSATGDPERDTASIGAFRCALLHLDRHDGTADAIDSAELLRVYQPELPVAFLHETAAEPMLRRGRALGPLFRSPDELEPAYAWARAQARRP